METKKPNPSRLEGVFDPHIHAGPDVMKRCMDDLDLARAAASAGMRGVLIKSHVESTAGRAYLTQKVLRQEARPTSGF